jgi:N-acetylglucosamine kinase-like BadF-type ATPase
MYGVAELVTGQGLERSRVAALTEDVSAVAVRGDVVAGSILDDAARRLSALVLATTEAARFLEADERIVVGSGGVLRIPRVLAGLRQHLATDVPGYSFVVPEVPPVIGAYYLALKDHGIELSEATRSRIVEQGAARELGSKALTASTRT